MAAKKNVKEQNGEGNVRQLQKRKQEKKPKWIWQHGKKIMNVEVTPK